MACARDGLITRRLRAAGSKGRTKPAWAKEYHVGEHGGILLPMPAVGVPREEEVLVSCAVFPPHSSGGGGVFGFWFFSADSAKKRERGGRARRRGVMDLRWRRRSRLDRASGGFGGERMPFHPVRFPPPDTGRRDVSPFVKPPFDAVALTLLLTLPYFFLF